MKFLGLVGVACVLLLASASPAMAQADLTVQSFNCPGGNTVCFRVHANTSTASLTLNGDILAAGGYKVVYTFAHPNNAVASSSNVATPIAGTGDPRAGTQTGPLYHRPGYAGSIIAVSIVSSQALTAQAAHAEAMRFDGTNAVATGLTAVIGRGLTNTQYAVATQARGTDIFTATEGVGCRTSVDASYAPTNSIIACAVTVSY